jgi:ABC-type Fe3+ transport system substrate-binding protein
LIYGTVPSQYFQPVIAAFNKEYPNINVTETTVDDNAVFSKYEAEGAQRARTADLLVASAPASWVQAEQNGVSANVTPTGLTEFPSWVNQGNGVFVMSAEPVLLAYSPKLLTAAEVPTTWAQLAADSKANPSKYKLVSYPVSNPLNYAGIYGLIFWERTRCGATTTPWARRQRLSTRVSTLLLGSCRAARRSAT